MKELLRSFLPKGHALSTHQDMGLTALQIFNQFLLAHKMVVNFSYDCSGYEPMLNLATRYELEWNKLVLVGRPVPSEEAQMAKNLLKEISYSGLNQFSKKELIAELQLKSYNLHTFMEILWMVTAAYGERFDLLRRANEFVNPYELKRANTQSDNNHPLAKKHKSDKTNVSSNPTLTTYKSICKGCGWIMRRKTETASPTCPRGDDNAGCGNDPRRNTTNA